MKNIRENFGAHVVALPYPTQGHISPMLQFCRRLDSKGVKASLAITKHIFTTLKPKSDGHVHLVTVSDGYDDGGFVEAESIAAYLASLETNGSDTLGDLIEQHASTDNPITCIVYDSFFPWCLNVAKKYGLLGASFFTQSCGVNYVYYLAHHGKLSVPVFSPPVDITGLPPLDASDLPSFLDSPESYPDYLQLVLDQISNVDEADFVLVNTVYELEDKVKTMLH